MTKRPLGTSAIAIAPLALGGNVFGWTADEATSFRILDRFVDAGFDLVDTADIYSTWVSGHSGGESEEILGKWFAKSGKRERLVLATKVGMEIGGTKGLKKARILQCAEDSLRRLRTDRIDLYQTHIDDPDTPVEETLEALAQLVRDGKVRAIGASQYGVQRLRESLSASERLGFPRYACLQPVYNLYEREAFEKELRPLCRESGLGVISFFALASGFLSGKYESLADIAGRPREARLEGYFDARGLRILAALREVATRAGSTPSAVAVAWVMAQPGISAPIASATSVAQLEELIAAASLELDAGMLAALDRASAAEGVAP
jgi:aryl-alcohol dehydrogenase-like predicted oxidoreductase